MEEKPSMNTWGQTWPERQPWALISYELGERVMFTLAFENHQWHANRAIMLVHGWSR